MAIQLAESQQGGKSPANKHGAYWREYRGCVRGQKNRQADSSAAHRPSQNLRPGIPEADWILSSRKYLDWQYYKGLENVRRGILAEDHRSSICILTPCIYCVFNIFLLFFIHISIHICWTDKLSIDKSPVTDLIKNFFLEKLFTLFTEYFCLFKSLCYTVNGWWTVNTLLFTFAVLQVKKDRRLPVRVGYFVMGSSHFGSQSALLSSLSVRLVCMPWFFRRFS